MHKANKKSQSQNTAQLDKMKPFELIGQQAASPLIKVVCRIFQLTLTPPPTDTQFSLSAPVRSGVGYKLNPNHKEVWWTGALRKML